MTLRHSKNMGLRESRRLVLQNNRLKYIIKQTQANMADLCKNLSSFLPFDNTVQADDCIDRLVTHRIKSKFHIDDPKVAADLQAAAFVKYVEYDAALSSELNLNGHENLVLRRARGLLHTWFGDFRLDVVSAHYHATPGETFFSSQGEVSITAKMFDKTHWSTTANCLDDTCIFIYNNAAFKRAATQHIGTVTRKESRKLFLRFRHTTDVGFHVFRHLLISRVLTIVDGARASSVPKSNEQRRFINVEAMFPVILQRLVAMEFKRILKKYGNDLGNFSYELTNDVTGAGRFESSAQRLHGLMIKDSRFSTIDFSNASDSVTIAAVCALFPSRVSDTLMKLRSHYVAIDDELISPKKLSSMGNGFTFEVMTAILYAVGSALTPFVRVYGDDVILPTQFASDFSEACKVIDFRINEKKTFIDSFFRESCGYFYSDHIEDYIISFDFGQVKTMADVITTCNKLSVIIECGQVSAELLETLTHTRDLINALVHASRKGPMPVRITDQYKYLSSYIYDTAYSKKAKRSKDLTFLRAHYINENAMFFTDHQLITTQVGLVYIPFFVPKGSRFLLNGHPSNVEYLPALYTGMRLNASIRGKGKWVDLPAFVDTDGTVTLISNVVRRNRSSVWADAQQSVFYTAEVKSVATLNA